MPRNQQDWAQVKIKQIHSVDVSHVEQNQMKQWFCS